MSGARKNHRAFASALTFVCCLVTANRPSSLISASRAEDVPPPAQAPTGFSTVDFGSTRYTIPDVYRPGITPYRAKGYKEGVGYAAFTLNLLVPDLKPQGSSQEGMTGHGWDRHLQALLEHGVDSRDLQDLVNLLLSWGKLDKENFVTESNGCHLYQGNMTVTQELHVCYLPGHLFVYDCAIKKYGPYPHCGVHERLNKDTTITYSFGKEYRDDAILIDDRMRALVTSFVSSNRPNQH